MYKSSNESFKKFTSHCICGSIKEIDIFKLFGFTKQEPNLTFCLFNFLILFQFLIFGSFFCCCSVAKLCPTLCDPIDCNTPGFPVLHHFLEFVQTLVYWVSDAIQPSHHLSLPSLPALNLSQHQGLFQWIGSSHQVAKLLELNICFKNTIVKYIFKFIISVTGM